VRSLPEAKLRCPEGLIVTELSHLCHFARRRETRLEIVHDGGYLEGYFERDQKNAISFAMSWA
jgi:hypothetical protein